MRSYKISILIFDVVYESLEDIQNIRLTHFSLTRTLFPSLLGHHLAAASTMQKLVDAIAYEVGR